VAKFATDANALARECDGDIARDITELTWFWESRLRGHKRVRELEQLNKADTTSRAADPRRVPGLEAWLIRHALLCMGWLLRRLVEQAEPFLSTETQHPTSKGRHTGHLVLCKREKAELLALKLGVPIGRLLRNDTLNLFTAYVEATRQASTTPTRQRNLGDRYPINKDVQELLLSIEAAATTLSQERQRGGKGIR
jgi:hypothetical protein